VYFVKVIGGFHHFSLNPVLMAYRITRQLFLHLCLHMKLAGNGLPSKFPEAMKPFM
jgi:hypothetical protein